MGWEVFRPAGSEFRHLINKQKQLRFIHDYLSFLSLVYIISRLIFTRQTWVRLKKKKEFYFPRFVILGLNSDKSFNLTISAVSSNGLAVDSASCFDLNCAWSLAVSAAVVFCWMRCWISTWLLRNIWWLNHYYSTQPGGWQG